MLTLIFLFFIALFAVGGIAISMSAKRRKAGAKTVPSQPATNPDNVGRANSDED